MESLKTVLKPFSKSIEERRVAVVGTMGSGKTTVLGLLHLTCSDRSNREKNFYFRVNEKTTGIRQVPSDLRNGLFPPPTPEGVVFEADLMMRWETPFGRQQIRLPFCETAGEEVQRLIMKFSAGMYEINPTDFTNASMLYEYILRSNGFIVIAPSTRVPMFKDAQGLRVGLEKEPTKIQDPDVNISRLLEQIYNYKERTGAPPIKGIAVLVTKCDAMFSLLAEKGMNLKTEDGMHKFMITDFPETMNILKFYGMDKVRFWPVWVELDYKQEMRDGKNVKVPIPHPVRGYRIRVHDELRIPYYSREEYLSLIDWIKETFV